MPGTFELLECLEQSHATGEHIMEAKNVYWLNRTERDYDLWNVAA